MKTTVWLLLAAVGLAGCAGFDLQGHRGARGLAPENTLPAFEKALAVGVDTLELDTAVTRDGVVVISHDPTLNPDITRGPDGRFLEQRGPAIRDLTFAELQRYDVGRLKPDTPYAKRYPEQQAVDGTRIPRLSDLFALVRRSGNRWVGFNIEIKTDPAKPAETLDPETFARALVDEVRRAGLASRVTIQSFDWRGLQAVQKIAPGIPTVYLSVEGRNFNTIRATDPEGSKWTAGFQLSDHGSLPKMVKAAGGRIWSPNFNDVTEAKVREAHELGLKVVVWTVNEPEQIRKMLDLGVDGIISDRPDLVKQMR